jgi:hypothetical protein
MASLTSGMITDPGATTMHSAKVTERVPHLNPANVSVTLMTLQFGC